MEQDDKNNLPGTSSTESSLASKIVKQSEMKCAVCSQVADKSCSGCRNVSYCSLDHQKADWKSHKKLCAPFSISVIDGVKVLTLRRNVSQGTILLDETPVFHVPESNGITVDSICLVCGLHMISSATYRCSVCAWPVCGSDCESHPIHKENECKIFTSTRVKYVPKMLNDLITITTQTRAITIKAISPNKWNDITDLLSGTTPYHNDWQLSNVGEYRKFIKRLLPNSNEKERKSAVENALTLRKVLMRRAYYVNAQDILDSKELTRSGKWRAGFYMYKKASLAKHSCAPNCVWNISNFPDFKIRLRAAYPLTKGEVLNVNHLEHHAEGQQGTVERRIGHFSRFGHICMCARCVDPTEFGTYSSAIVCKNCRGPDSKDKIESENVGYLLADNGSASIGIKRNTLWRCNSCGEVTPLTKIYPKVDSITKALEANDGKSDEYVPIIAEDLARDLIAEHRDIFLHPNHWLIQKATLILIDHGYEAICSKRKSSDEDVDNLLAQCHSVLTILNQLYPGLSTLKSKLTISLTGTVATQMDCVLSKLKDANNDSEMCDQLMFYTDELLGLKTDLLAFYKDDVPVERGNETSEMAKILEKDVRELSNIVTMVSDAQQMPD